MSLSPFLYYGLVFGIILGIGVILRVLRVDAVFVVTFVLLGCIYMSVSVWEALNEELLGMTHTYWIDGVAHFYWFSLWWMTIGIATISFLVLYIAYQIHDSRHFVWDKTIAMVALVGGIAMVFGVVEDFGVFTMWGFEHFNLTDAPWHQSYLFNLFPTFYLWLIPGVILTGIALTWSILNRQTKRAISDASILRQIKTTCPPNVRGCLPVSEFLGVDYQLCLTKKMQLCLKKK